MIRGPDLIAEACRFYGWRFNDAWEMPASRFFAMLNSARKIEAREMLEQLDLAAVPICTSKWYDHLREKWSQRLDSLSGHGPSEEAIERERKAAMGFAAPATEEEKVTMAMNQFAMMKRLNGHGG